MDALAKTNLEQTAQLTELQKTVENKLAEITLHVTKEVLETIIVSYQMAPAAFIATHIVPKQEALTQLDERTSKFFHKMMNAINEELYKNSATTTVLVVFEILAQKAQIKQTLVEGIALPHVKKLIVDLDKIKTSIVDDINA